MIVPPPIPVLLAVYDPEWPHMAAGHAERLRGLGSILLKVHHIGSTSVPGLMAKPIIDLLPVVTDLTDLDLKQERVEALGYKWHGEFGMSGRRYCTLSYESGVRIAQLHFFKMDSLEIVRHIAFRDYLRAHSDVARAYEREKMRARNLYPSDSHSYTDEKAAWVQDTESNALIWFAKQSAASTG